MRVVKNIPNSDISDLTNYPQGRIKNATTGVSGTPVVEELYGDMVQNMYQLLSLGGETVTNEADNVGAGFQIIRAMEKIFEPIGTIRLSASATIPAGWLICNGSTYDHILYSELASVIGTTFETEIGYYLPNLAKNFPIGSGQTTGDYGTVGYAGGEATHVLSTDEMPNHTHSSIELQSIEVVVGTAAIDAYEDTGNTAPTGDTGGGLAHNNMPPYQVCVYIIKAKYHGDPS